MIRVAGPAPYDVVVGHGVADRLPGLLGDGVTRVAVVHPEGLAADALIEALEGDYDVLGIAIPDGEAAKTAAVAAACWEALGEAGFTRSDAVVTFGGGATTDLGGFVAATWLRGVKVVHVPTTLLGHGRRRGRRQDRHQHRCRQEPGRLLPRARRRALRPGHPRHAAARRAGRRPRRGGQVRLHRRPGDPRPGRGDRPRRPDRRLRGAARARRARDPGQGRGRRGRPQGDRRRSTGTPVARRSTTATPWRTPSSAPRTTRSGTARPSPSAASSSPSSPAAPGCSLPRSWPGTTPRSPGSGCPRRTTAHRSRRCTPR